MGTVEIKPVEALFEGGSKNIVGGPATTLAALTDGLDTTYVEAAGNLNSNWGVIYRFEDPTPLMPANAAISHLQMKMRFSHFTRTATGSETIKPIVMLIGRTKKNGTGIARWDGNTREERNAGFSTTETPTDQSFVNRNKNNTGRFFLGEKFQIADHKIANRAIYGWIAVKRRRVFNEARVYEFSIVVTYVEKPTVTILTPSGIEPESRPTINWEFSDPEGQPQDVARIRIWTQAVADQPLFSPENPFLNRFRPLYNRLVRTSQLRHDLVNLGLDNGDYRVYIRARDAHPWRPKEPLLLVPPGGSTWLAPLSDWATSDFTIQIAVPRRPIVTATFDAVKNGIQVDVRGLDNMLSWNSSSIEEDAVGFTSLDTTLTQVITEALHGNASMEMTRNTSVGDANLQTPVAQDFLNGGVKIEPGRVYTGRAAFKTAATERTCRVALAFFDELGNSLSATNTLYELTDKTTEWTEVYCVVTAPVDAAFVTIDARALDCVVGEVHFVDQLAIFDGRRFNLLSENQATIETDTTGWIAGTDTTIARSTDKSHEGEASLELDKTNTSGTASASTPSGTSGFRVAPSVNHVAAAWISPFSDTSPLRDVRVLVDWYDSAGALISTSTGSTVTEIGTGFVQPTVTDISPATAEFARVRVEVLNVGVNQKHFVDEVGIWFGTTVGDVWYWDQGGFVHDDPEDRVTELQRSTENDEFGNPIWEIVPSPRTVQEPEFQRLTFVDYELPSNFEADYRAKVEALNFEGGIQKSLWAKVVTEQMPVFDSWWLRDPLRIDRTMKLRVVSANAVTPKPNTTDYPVGANAAVMTHDGVKLDVLRLVVDLLDEDTHDLFRLMMDSGITLLLQDVHGGQWYGQPSDIEYEFLRAAKQISEIWPVRFARRASFEFVSVEKPRALGVTIG